jgi:hypothetical protein
MTHEQELDLLDRIAAERGAGNGQVIEGVCKSSKIIAVASLLL